jgi:hypothetical protein
MTDMEAALHGSTAGMSFIRSHATAICVMSLPSSGTQRTLSTGTARPLPSKRKSTPLDEPSDPGHPGTALPLSRFTGTWPMGWQQVANLGITTRLFELTVPACYITAAPSSSPVPQSAPG